MIYYCEPGKGGYRPGSITFFPKPGKTLDLLKIEESIRATRLSGGTSMSTEYLEITALGDTTVDDKAALFKVSGTGQTFALKDAANLKAKEGEKTPLQRLREAVAGGARVVSVTGRVDGWTGQFPMVLRGLAKRSAETPTVLFLQDFEARK
jgi:hypothetical protein